MNDQERETRRAVRGFLIGLAISIVLWIILGVLIVLAGMGVAW